LRIIPLLLIAVLFCPLTYGKVVYVDDDATVANDGTSWANAYWCLQDALADASTGDEIRVAQGIYKPDQKVMIGRNTRVVASGDRTATFQLKNGVTVKGGYAGFGEPDPDARDIEVYNTILSGDLNGNDGLNFVNNHENSYHVVTGNGTDETAVLDGFTITAGNANGNQPHHGGGGMCSNYSGSPTVTDCTFSGNSAQAGGGMFNESNGKPIVTNCTFSGNLAEEGGGMLNHYYVSPIVTNCTFTNNSATVGGGMFNRNCTPVVTDCTFTSNSAGSGGGMQNDSNGNPIVTNCTVTGNLAQNNGGGMVNHFYSSPTVTNCTFTSNSAGDGGGMFNQTYSNPIVTNCTFTGNTVRYNGGGMDNFNSSPTLTNCTLEDNSAGWDGGGMINRENSSLTLINCVLSGNSATDRGGGIFNYIDCEPTIANCTFCGNSAGKGGAMYSQEYSSSTLTNCILWGNNAVNGPQLALYEGCSVTVKSCDLQGGLPGIDIDQSSIVTWGLGNTEADPLFVNAADADYHLQSGSPCINAGDNSAIPQSVVEDLDGNPRIAYGVVDMGAYEYNPQLTTFDPIPADGATDVTQTPILSWTAGEGAILHDVYFGTDEEAVRNATLRSPEYKATKDLGSESYEPGKLQWSTTYYWRVDEYNADEAISEGSVWSFTVMVLADPLAEAMDTALRFTTGGSADWFSQTITSCYDGDAAQSGGISHDQESWMQTTVSGAGTFSFYWKVSSETSFDFLEFYIDDLLQDRISGSVDWHVMTYEITDSGLHTLEWRYVKDASMNRGSDCGWVDKAVWVFAP
jgi:parallel beta-helix repeat protein/predicted outer membrane repeat protein